MDYTKSSTQAFSFLRCNTSTKDSESLRYNTTDVSRRTSDSYISGVQRENSIGNEPRGAGVGLLLLSLGRPLPPNYFMGDYVQPTGGSKSAPLEQYRALSTTKRVVELRMTATQYKKSLENTPQIHSVIRAKPTNNLVQRASLEQRKSELTDLIPFSEYKREVELNQVRRSLKALGPMPKDIGSEERTRYLVQKASLEQRKNEITNLIPFTEFKRRVELNLIRKSLNEY
ncbi:hypothetical protein GNP82_12355 [Aliivibrio fischeri]|uniref:hypothetical protein n=1 Tax=Aliivibrio fischeri TaxID=668 RepID=UPI0012D9E7EE|nr:hypothetical protein [Aliivibrio fischeri]MUK38346.1 hypothetical protein [Aliivibrio fischeri]MUL04935.1 hypothetical protein [Aliivibrio fischeri]